MHRSFRLVVIVATALALGACGRGPGPNSPAAEPKGAGVPKPVLPDPKLPAIHPEQVVPHFRVTTLEGAVLDSKKILSERPMMLVFFSSWCPICEKKLPVLRRALDAVGNKVQTVGVVLDEEDSWSAVAPYIEAHHLDFPMVRGEQYLNFSVAFNPIGGVPWVVVIDKRGRIGEVQLGLAPNHYDRLVAAVEHASEPELAK